MALPLQAGTFNVMSCSCLLIAKNSVQSGVHHKMKQLYAVADYIFIHLIGFSQDTIQLTLSVHVLVFLVNQFAWLSRPLFQWLCSVVFSIPWQSKFLMNEKCWDGIYRYKCNFIIEMTFRNQKSSFLQSRRARSFSVHRRKIKFGLCLLTPYFLRLCWTFLITVSFCEHFFQMLVDNHFFL